MESVLEFRDAARGKRPEARHAHSPPTAARAAVTTFFLVNGMLFGTWVSRIPAIQSMRNLSHASLGLALLAIAFGALIAMPLAGRFMAQFGSRRITQWAVVVYAALLPALALIPDAWMWISALFVFGVSHGALDVSMNAQAVAVENGYSRPIMSSIHAQFSLGGLAGAALGALAAAQGVAPFWHFLVVGASLLAITVVFASPRLIDDWEPHHQPRASRNGFSFPKPVLLAIGGVAFCAMMGEGAMADWSGIYLRKVLGSSEAIAAVGYAAFSVAMAFTRFTGDYLTTRFGPARLVRLSGLLATAGMAVALISPSPGVAMFGFALVGAGFATVVPTAFSAAGRTSGVHSGVALATATTVGYLGFLLGPPVIGFVAEWAGLRGALVLILATSALIVLLAGAVRAEKPVPED